MNFKVLVPVVIALTVFSSCSKPDEMMEPTPTPTASTWVTYTHTVSAEHAQLIYDLEYMTAAGVVKVSNLTGNFTKRVPVMRYDSAGKQYVRTKLSFTVRKPGKSNDTPLLNSGMKITTDYGFVIAQTNINADGCGNTERVLEEVLPLSWFYVR